MAHNSFVWCVCVVLFLSDVTYRTGPNGTWRHDKSATGPVFWIFITGPVAIRIRKPLDQDLCGESCTRGNSIIERKGCITVVMLRYVIHRSTHVRGCANRIWNSVLQDWTAWRWLGTSVLIEPIKPAGLFPRRRGRTAGKPPTSRNFVISSVSNVSKLRKRLNINEKSWHDGHGKKALRIVVTCPLKMAVFQRKVDIGHVGHVNFIKSLRARNMYSCNLRTWDVCERDYVMWVCKCTCMIVCTWLWMYECLFMYGTCHFVHVMDMYAYSCLCEWS